MLEHFGLLDLRASSDDSEFGFSQQYSPEETYQQERRARKSAKKAARKAAAQKSAPPPKQQPSVVGSQPPKPSLPTQNRFGVLEEPLKPLRSYADFVREQEQARPRQSPVRKAPPGDDLSPVPGLDVMLVPAKPGSASKRT